MLPSNCRRCEASTVPEVCRQFARCLFSRAPPSRPLVYDQLRGLRPRNGGVVQLPLPLHLSRRDNAMKRFTRNTRVSARGASTSYKEN